MVTKELEKTKAVVKVNPFADPAYESLKAEVGKYAQYVLDKVVDSPKAVTELTVDVNIGAKLGKQIEQLRKGYKDPLVQYGKAIDAAFKPLSDPIERARQIAAQKIRAFNDEQREKQRKIDEENARLAREQAEREARIEAENEARQAERTVDEDGVIEGPDLIPVPEEVEHIPDAPVVQKASTDFGSASERMVGKFQLVDIKMVPANLLLLNERAVNALLRAGIREIEGLKIWEEPEVSFRSK